MKTIIVLISAVLVAAPACEAGRTSLQKGMTFLSRHYFEDALRVLHTDAFQKTDGEQLALGMSCLANAHLYFRLHDAHLTIFKDYANLLAQKTQTDASASRLLPLYQAKALLAMDENKMAEKTLTRFLQTPGLAEQEKNEALIDLSIALHHGGHRDKAAAIRRALPLGSFERQARLAAARCRTPLDPRAEEKKTAAVIDRATAATAALITPAATAALISIYAHHGPIDKGLDFILQADLKRHHVEERISDHNVIRYYDPMLLKDLAVFYTRAAVFYLEKANTTQDPAIRATAAYYLGGAHALGNDKDAAKAARFLAVFLGAGPQPDQIPAELPARALVQYKALNSNGAPNAARCGALMEAVRIQDNCFGVDEALVQCAFQTLACADMETLAYARLERATGRAFDLLNRSLGGYYRAHGNMTRALDHLEAGRNKAMKNHIEANPPLFLIDLAQTYYHAKRFSESLEIYFAMSRQFPAIRCIQEALQGVYAMAQQSAGDARLF